MPYGLLAEAMDLAIEARDRDRYQRELLALVSCKRLKYKDYVDRMREFDHPLPKRSSAEIKEMVERTIAADKERRR